ncbi:TadE/TadG family type IV pilus assembly protein [Rhizobium sp. RU36D]|uniref:vWA domain-containing protein n=1 Tax=Rhizobium sp. RU36D TaxID=1907415 RepID=UPI0009D86304|nr:TadE/TadG family type IV pilus assembly protein [Rhizobium sp. RU36D]SMC42936.1 Flp pilus assembly protein TadG [Rhizobium sp. RU36D]
MTGSHRKYNLLTRLMKSDGGNFGIMTAILLPVTLATAGVAIDLTRMVEVRSELQNAADSAALAAASAMSEKSLTKDEAIKLAQEYLAAQMVNQAQGGGGDEAVSDSMKDELEKATVVTATETANGPTGKIYDIKVTATYNVAMNGMTRLLGFNSMPVSVTSSTKSATESKNALSMYLVLDRSGSMAWVTESLNTSKTRCNNYTEAAWPDVAFRRPCYISKIETLKTAVQNLADVLEEADPDHMYARTGAVSYNSSMQTPSSFTWGTASTVAYVDALPADGGTDSAAAMAEAFARVSAATETTAHKNKNGQVPSRYIVFMTDGDNNYSSADVATKKTCDDAKKAGIEIYTVAFMAPSRGKTLLKDCASSDDHYSEAESAAELVAEFKAIGEKASAAMTRLTN